MSGNLRAGAYQAGTAAVGLVHRDIREPVEYLTAAILRLVTAHEPRALLDERGAQVAGGEVRVIQHGLQERDVRRHAAQSELGESALRASDGRGEVATAAGHLDQHRVEVRRNLCATVHRATIEADSGTPRRAVRRDLARVGAEAGRRVFRRDPALQRGAAQSKVLLLETELGKRLPRGNAHLRLHEVDIRDLLGDGVLDLDARVHLDEKVLAFALTNRVEQKLDGSRVLVVDGPRKRDRVAVHGLADVLIQVRSRRDLDHLLVATLHGAVTLEQVDGLAGRIGEDLNLDVPRAHHGLLEKHGGVAKRAVGLRIAASRASRRSSFFSTRRIPRPPPPATAFAKIGNPMASAPAMSSSMSLDAGVDASTGTPAAIACSLAVTLLPAISSTLVGGPMKVIPASAAAWARSGFSDRNPYPG